MKKLITVLLIIPGLVLAIIIVTSCTKEGPAGPAGEDGIDGNDGTATCKQCHNSGESFLAKVIQWEASTHASGGNFERNSVECAICHTSMGFKEWIVSDADTTLQPVSNPTPINCYTCHKVHETYTAEDWELVYSDPVSFLFDGTSSTDQGVANLCSKCHQSRKANPMPVPDGDEDVTITSPYWGPHHGPQANMYVGMGGYEVGDGYENSFHTDNIEKSCKSCHMASAYGVQAGGHQMGMTYAYHGHDVVNKAGCIDCHSDPDNLDTKIEETALELEDLLADLLVLLIDQGIYSETTSKIIPGTYTNDQAGAYFNYKFVEEDRSNGSHNYKYAKKLLENSIDAIQ
ncbi:MAG: hypothetical protein ABFS05_09095 [Bacteroidota bacterium]